MKKLLSIILSVVMIVSVGALSVPVMAEVGSIETTAEIIKNKIIPQVNGNNSGDVTYEWISENPKQIKFTYTGDGTLEDWEFGDLEEGVDYRIIAQDDNTITIELLDATFNGDIVANAIVDEGEEEPTTSAKTTTKANTTTKKSTSPTSPKTGAAAAAGIAVMGAGVAILSALKKKED